MALAQKFSIEKTAVKRTIRKAQIEVNIRGLRMVRSELENIPGNATWRKKVERMQEHLNKSIEDLQRFKTYYDRVQQMDQLRTALTELTNLNGKPGLIEE